MRMILARLTIFCGVFPSAISCCSCSRAFRSSTNRDSSCSIREMNHDHTRDSNVRDRTLVRSAPHLVEQARSPKSPCEGTAMDLADLIEPDQVVYAARASNKQQLLQDLASRAATQLNLD